MPDGRSGARQTTGSESRVLDRAELPVDTAELARFLIGKMLIRTLDGRRGGRPHRRDRGLCHRRPRGSRLSRHDPAQSGAFPRARARLCLSRLWRLVHAERLERDARRRRGRPDQGDRANRRRRDHGAKSRRQAAARPCAGPGTALRGAWRSIAGWTGSIFARPARYGSDPLVRRPAKSGRANGSASPARPTVRSGSTFAAIGSSAARKRSTGDRPLAVIPSHAMSCVASASVDGRTAVSIPTLLF